MKHLIVILLFLTGSLFAQSPIEDFDKVMQAYNEEYTATDDPKKHEEINAKYEVLISEAEKILEAALEKQFQEENAALEKEQKESLVIEEDETNEEDEEEQEEETEVKEMTDEQRKATDYIIEIAALKDKTEITGELIAKIFLKTNDKNTYSTVGLAKIFNVYAEGKEIDIANRIASKIQLLK